MRIYIGGLYVRSIDKDGRTQEISKDRIDTLVRKKTSWKAARYNLAIDLLKERSKKERGKWRLAIWA